jgi:hypothetical protein
MSFSRYRTADFGRSKAGLATVGYTLQGGTRTAAGVAQVGTATGIYGATITFPDGYTGYILWDSGETTPVYVAGAINPGSDEYEDAKVSSASGSTTGGGVVQLDLTQPLADVKTGTVGGALHGAWASAFGMVSIDIAGKLLRMFGFNSQTTPLVTFDLDSSSRPTQRTPRP